MPGPTDPGSRQGERLTVQQRGFLAEAAKREWISGSMFAGASKPKSAGTFYPTITANSASAVLRRLAKRGLIQIRPGTHHLYEITDAGRAALDD
jgi:hypothetical protein